MKDPENSQNEFPAANIVPVGGLLEAIISEDSFIEEEMSLKYTITINLVPISIENELFDTAIRIYGIKPEVRSWKELSDKVYLFPEQPVEDNWKGEYYPIEDYVSGSLYLFEIYNPVKVSRIEFGRISNDTITVKLEMEIDFRKAGFKPIKIVLETELTIGAVAIHGDVTEVSLPDLESASEIAGKFLNLNDYKEAVLNGSVKFYPRL